MFWKYHFIQGWIWILGGATWKFSLESRRQVEEVFMRYENKLIIPTPKSRDHRNSLLTRLYLINAAQCLANKYIFSTYLAQNYGLEIIWRKEIIFQWSESLSPFQVFLTPWTLQSHGTVHARMLEWVAFPLSRGSSWPSDRTCVSCIAGAFFDNWATSKAPWICNRGQRKKQNFQGPVFFLKYFKKKKKCSFNLHFIVLYIFSGVRHFNDLGWPNLPSKHSLSYSLYLWCDHIHYNLKEGKQSCDKSKNNNQKPQSYSEHSSNFFVYGLSCTVK